MMVIKSLLRFLNRHSLRLKCQLSKPSKELSVKTVPTSHCEAPFVLYLTTHVQVQLSNQQTIPSSTERRSSRTIRGSDVAASVKMSKIVVRFFGVSTCELVGVDLSSNPIDSHRKVVIGNGGISGLNAPKRFRKTCDCG